MDLIRNINHNLNRTLKETKELVKKQELLLEKINKDVQEKDKHVLPLKTTIHNLIKYGISKDEILSITNISSEQYEKIVEEKRYYQPPYAYLDEEESIEFDRLLSKIHTAQDIQELIDPAKESERILFIHSVLGRYHMDYKTLKSSQEIDDYENTINKFIDKTRINGQAKNAYLSMVRVFGNEIKRKREEVLISFSTDKEC